jgi:hypothetical protein
VQTYQDDLEEHLLIDLHEFLVPLINIGGLLSNIVIVVVGGWRIGLVIGAPFDDFSECRFIDLCLCERSKVMVEVRVD